MTETTTHTPDGGWFTVIPGAHREETKNYYGPDGRLLATEKVIVWEDGTYVSDRLDYKPDGTTERSGHTKHTDGTFSHTTYQADGTVTTEHPMHDGDIFTMTVHPDGSRTQHHKMEVETDATNGFIDETTEYAPDGTISSTHEYVQSTSLITGEKTDIFTTRRPDGYVEVTTVVHDRDGNELRRTHEVFDPANPPPPPPPDASEGGGSGGGGGFEFNPSTRTSVATRGGSGGWVGGGGVEHVLDWYWVTEGESTYLFTTPKVKGEHDDNDW